MPKGPIRRGQLVAPFGVGSMIVIRDGTSLIAAGLDHWYEREDGNTSGPGDPNDFRIEEWRLERQLRVDHFRLPPDFREPHRGESVPNALLTVPFLRFPQWHLCSSCNLLDRRPLSERGRIICPECERVRKKRSAMSQVRFVAMCERGHLQDFPWMEWVHHSAAPSCNGPIRLAATGGASLAGERVSCDGCGRTRTLGMIMEATHEGDRGSSFLSENLADGGARFLCQGKTPWLGLEDGNACENPLRGSLRSATNLYFAHVKSAIYLPRGTDAAPSELILRLESPPLSSLIKLMAGAGGQLDPKDLRAQQTLLLHGFTDEQISAGLRIVTSGTGVPAPEPETADDTQGEFAVRREEYNALQTERDEPDLKIQFRAASAYDDPIPDVFARVMLVHRLRETRVFTGFTRTFSETDQTLDDRKALLWRQVPQGRDTWLPAYVVYGEGIFIEFEGERLREWEGRDGVARRVTGLVDRFARLQQDRRLAERSITPRFMLLHTFAHLLMNQLTFECGYSSAALRERLYVSTDVEHPMAGVLIYTAAGDAEGTMGGLVRMGKPGYLDPVVLRAIEEARWCSADPVCMELGAKGQGPDSCNLAACHNCALVPETACEEFNRFLDRALLVGDVDDSSIAFFS